MESSSGWGGGGGREGRRRNWVGWVSHSFPQYPYTGDGLSKTTKTSFSRKTANLFGTNYDAFIKGILDLGRVVFN